MYARCTQELKCLSNKIQIFFNKNASLLANRVNTKRCLHLPSQYSLLHVHNRCTRSAVRISLYYVSMTDETWSTTPATSKMGLFVTAASVLQPLTIAIKIWVLSDILRCCTGLRFDCHCRHFCLGELDFNLFQANASFLYPVKTSENLFFSGVFRGYRNG